MQITTTDGKTFRLQRETDADQQLLDAFDHTRSVFVTDVERLRTLGGGFEANTVLLTIDRNSEPALVAQAGRQALSALGQLFSLGLREAAHHGHIGPAPTNPQPQEQLAASLVQLQVMLNTLGDVVVKQEIMFKEVCCAHGGPLVVENAIVKACGVAA